MKYIWNWIDEKHLSAEKKYNLCLWIASILLAAAGCALYALLNPALHLAGEWLVILAGWPVLISWVAVFLYGCRHPFHE